MPRFFSRYLFAPLVFLLYFAATLFWALPLFLLIPLKLFSRGRWRAAIDSLLIRLGRGWIASANLVTGLFFAKDWEIRREVEFSPDGWYLVVANHQSWVDSLVMAYIFGHRLPFPKVFAKRELLRVPLVGAAVWALDFPLMHRHSRTELEKNPALRGQDLERSRAACCLAVQRPATIALYPEGTRFTPVKHRLQDSPYRQLLRPRAGGMALALESIGPRLTSVVDLTIVYPRPEINLWDFLAGQVKGVRVELRPVELPEELRAGGYDTDSCYRRHFQEWVNSFWQRKDEHISEMVAMRQD